MEAEAEVDATIGGGMAGSKQVICCVATGAVGGLVRVMGATGFATGDVCWTSVRRVAVWGGLAGSS